MSTVEKKKYSRSKEDRMKGIRRWIFQAVKSDAEGNGVAFSTINKFLEQKEKGASKRPEAKEIVKAALKMGTLVRVDRMYRLNANKKDAGKKAITKKAQVKKVVKKITPRQRRRGSSSPVERNSQENSHEVQEVSTRPHSKENAVKKMMPRQPVTAEQNRQENHEFEVQEVITKPTSLMIIA